MTEIQRGPVTLHKLTQRGRTQIRKALSNLADEYEKAEKQAETKLDNDHMRAQAKEAREYLISLRNEFAEPGTPDEAEASQEDMFTDSPFQRELKAATTDIEIVWRCPDCDFGYDHVPDKCINCDHIPEPKRLAAGVTSVE